MKKPRFTKAQNAELVADLNTGVDLGRKTETVLRMEGWHYLLFKGPNTPINLRCPDRQHITKLSPMQAIKEGCPVCALMDAPPTSVDVNRFKADVMKQDKILLKSVRRSMSKKRRGGGGERYAI
jgi:hypothetical protein